MRIINKPSDHLNNSFNKVGVLLINLGTPEGTDYFSIRKYLNEFLSDRRVIDIFRPLWWLILNGPILLFRPSKSGKAYKRIWNKKKGSPLRYITESQAKKLKIYFKNHNSIKLDYAMRYGNPSIKSKLENLFNSGCSKILLMPLYPQYSASTTASVQDEAYKWLLEKRWQPAIRTVAPWYDDKNYINIISKSIKNSFDKDGEFEAMVQVGSKKFPETEIRSHSEAYYQLRKTLGSHDQHNSIDITQHEYKTRKFVLGFDMEKVLEAGFTGINTRQGDIMSITFNHNSGTASHYAKDMQIVLTSDQIMEIADSGVTVYD